MWRLKLISQPTTWCARGMVWGGVVCGVWPGMVQGKCSTQAQAKVRKGLRKRRFSYATPPYDTSCFHGAEDKAAAAFVDFFVLNLWFKIWKRWLFFSFLAASNVRSISAKITDNRVQLSNETEGYTQTQRTHWNAQECTRSDTRI